MTLAALAACKKDDMGPGKQDSNSGSPEIEVTSSNPVELGYEAGTFSVDLSVQGGLELDGLGATIRQEGEWLSYTGAESGSSAGTAVMSFKYLANDTQEARGATVTVTYPDADPVTVSVSQDGKPEGGEDPVGERYVAYMKKHYAGTASWARPEVMKFGKTITVEMLVKHDADFVSKTGDRTQWQGDWIGSMFGIEARFLIRHGDNTDNYQEWEVVYVDAENNAINIKSSIDLPADVWTHIAVVFDGIAKTVTLYQDGKVAASEAMNENAKDIDLTILGKRMWYSSSALDVRTTIQGTSAA